MRRTDLLLEMSRLYLSIVVVGILGHFLPEIGARIVFVEGELARTTILHLLVLQRLSSHHLLIFLAVHHAIVVTGVASIMDVVVAWLLVLAVAELDVVVKDHLVPLLHGQIVGRLVLCLVHPVAAILLVQKVVLWDGLPQPGLHLEPAPLLARLLLQLLQPQLLQLSAVANCLLVAILSRAMSHSSPLPLSLVFLVGGSRHATLGPLSSRSCLVLHFVGSEWQTLLVLLIHRIILFHHVLALY